MIRRYNELVVETPEGVQFVYQLASPVSRSLALIVDLAAINMIIALVAAALNLLGMISQGFAFAILIIIYFAVSIGYFVVYELFLRGQTLGKKMLRLRVIDARGMKIKPGQIMLRNLLRAVDSLPFFYFLGGASALISKKSQRLGDIAAGTVVIRQPEIDAPMLPGIAGNSFNSFGEHPRLEAQLRKKTTPEQSEIALQAVMRRDEIDPDARIELFARLAAFFRGVVEFPEDISSTISDEQYVRNCVDSIYRGAKHGGARKTKG